MTLPNEIDQDVACPDCGEAFAILDDGAGRCENGNCVSAHEWRSRKHVAALRNQRKPGTVEIDATLWADVVRAHGDVVIGAPRSHADKELVRAVHVAIVNAPRVVLPADTKRTPNTTEIPTSELERLREARESHCVATRRSTSNPDRDEDRVAEAFGRFDDAIDAILARIPAKVKTDHVAVLREALEHQRQLRDGGAVEKANARIAALEAAIELFEKEGKS